MRIVAALLIALAWPLTALADTLPISAPPVNTPLVGCVEGRALRIVNGAQACSTGTVPTLTGCGTGSTLSSNATDFSGKITTGTGLISSCTLVLSKLYANPSMGCVVQSNSANALALSPNVGATAKNTTIVIPLTVNASGATITYACFPV